MLARTSRWPIAFAAGAAAAMAVAGTGASAAPHRATVHPTVTVQDVTVGQVVSFVVGVTYPLPTGVSPASACKGTVALSHKSAGRKKATTWSGKLGSSGGGGRGGGRGQPPPR